MKVKNQTITHNGTGNINMDCTVYENRYDQSDNRIQELNTYLSKVQRLIPTSLSQTQQEAIINALNELKESSTQNNKTKLQSVFKKLKSFSSSAVTTATFAAAITDLITFLK